MNRGSWIAGWVAAALPRAARAAAELLCGVHAQQVRGKSSPRDLVTEWDTFRALDLARLKATLAAPVVVELRNVYRPEEMRRHGFTYVSVGRT